MGPEGDSQKAGRSCRDREVGDQGAGPARSLAPAHSWAARPRPASGTTTLSRSHCSLPLKSGQASDASSVIRRTRT